jgi:hypothetical protein
MLAQGLSGQVFAFYAACLEWRVRYDNFDEFDGSLPERDY